MCDFMQKCYNTGGGGASEPEGEVIIKGERCYRFLQRRNARIASALLAIAIPSVSPSDSHAGIVSK